MAVKISEVKVSPQEVTIGQTINIVIVAQDIDWNNLKTDFTNWDEVKSSFTNWNKVLNYIYTKPAGDTDCVYDSTNQSLFDANDQQVSIIGGYTSKYSAEVIDNFIGEVLNE